MINKKSATKLISVFIIILGVLSAFGCTQNEVEPMQYLTAEVDAYVEPFFKAAGFSGTILMAKDGKILLNKGYGMADLDWNIPNTPHTRFQIASVSKSFTAAAVMILAEQGLLSINDVLSEFIPDYPHGERITIHHLLTHTSGITNVNELAEYELRSKYHNTLDQIIKMFKSRALEHEPGERYSYSNSNYNLLAYIIEKVSGQSFGDFLCENIFEPLGMKNTGHPFRAGDLVPDRAKGYAPSGEIDLQIAPYLDWTIKTGNGSLYSTVEDLYKWDRALYVEKILRQKTLNMVFQKYINNVGYGWFVRERLGRRVTAINGRSPGFAAYLERYIDDDACIIILSNIYTSAPFQMIQGLAAIMFDEEYEKPPSIDYRKISSETLANYLGNYRFEADFYRPKAEVVLENIDEAVVLKWSQSYFYPLLPISKDKFLDRMFWAYITFNRNESGAVTGFTWRDPDEFSALRLLDIK